MFKFYITMGIPFNDSTNADFIHKIEDSQGPF